MSTEPGLVWGSTDERFRFVRELLAERASAADGWSAALAAYLDGRLIVDLWSSPGYARDSLQVAYSSSKGAASVCLALLIERGELDAGRHVAEYWPEFAAAGKEDITVAQLVSHQAGLVGPPDGFSLDAYIEHSRLATALAHQAPLWPPGTAHGYHALTWGTMVDELVRRVTGEAVGAIFESEVAQRYAIEFFFGLPESEEPRLVTSQETEASVGARADTGVAAIAFGRDRFPPLAELEHERRARASSLPAVGGIASARGLAKLYAAATTGADDLPPLLSPATAAAVARTYASGPDLVLGVPTSFGLGFQTPSESKPLGGPGSFGHDGFAGSLGLASPAHGLAVGFFTNQIPQPDGGADPFAQTVIESLITAVSKTRQQTPPATPVS